VIVLLRVAVLWVVKLSPVVFVLSAAIQVNVDATLAPRGILTDCPLQMLAVAALVIVGAGLTVTVAVLVAPAQPLAVGVIV
jgi:hypothetical protein